MLTNYFKVAMRNLFRRKGFSAINICGLAVGMASAILIILWIQNEISYDRFHEKGNRLYEVWSNDVVNNSIRSLVQTPEIMATVLKKDFPEIEAVSRVNWNRNLLFSVGDKRLQVGGTMVDPDFLTMFSFPLTKGTTAALNSSYSIVLTQKLAQKLFGHEDPMGKIIRIEKSDNFTVTGVLKDLPGNTLFDFEYLLSYELATANKWLDEDWTDIGIRTFVLLKPNTSVDLVNSKIKTVIPKYSGGRAKTEEFLYPLGNVRLYSQFENGKAVGGRIRTVKTFGIIAAFILLIACINFMNLSTARSERRAREVGIRKVAGALRKSLIGQFLGESILIAFVAALIAVVIVRFSLPAFDKLTQKQLSIDYTNIYVWLSGIAFILFTGILAGSYPAFFLSAFTPVTVLKGGFKKMTSLVTPRKALVVLQFTFAIVLIVCTIIIERQIKYAQARESGYSKKSLVYVYTEGEIGKNFELIKNALLNSGAVDAVSGTMSPLTQSWSSAISMQWQGKDPNTKVEINRSSTNGDLVKTSGMKLVQGRDIDVKNYPTDSTACLINESAARLMNFKNSLGQIISEDSNDWHVVGVIKDFIVESPYQPIRPMIFRGPKEAINVVNIKLNNRNNTAGNLATLEKIFKKYNPEYPFQYQFVDEEYARKFGDEQLIGKLSTLFAILTIFISCLGLFGLASYMAENRVKEIGIRKVLGASVENITALLSKEFLKPVVMAFAIASPVAWFFMNKWLRDYDYRINISWWIFLVAGLLAILIAVITISYQSIKAAIANPVKSLRTE